MKAAYFAILTAGLVLGLCAAAEQEPRNIGMAAPNVSVVDEAGKSVSLTAYKDKQGVVLFFFPKASSVNCTTESCGFRDDAKAFTEKGYVMIGVSRDTPEKLSTFKEKNNLGYSLWSDPDGTLAKALKVQPGARQTVVIGKDGKITHFYIKANAASNSKDVLKDLGTGK